MDVPTIAAAHNRNKMENTNYYKYAFFNKTNTQHKYVLSLAHQLGWTKEHPKWGKVTNLDKLGHFIAHRTQSKKPLLKQTVIELQKTIYALEQIL